MIAPVVTETFEDVTTSVKADNGDETFTTTRNYTTVTAITKHDLVTKVYDDDTCRAYAVGSIH